MANVEKRKRGVRKGQKLGPQTPEHRAKIAARMAEAHRRRKALEAAALTLLATAPVDVLRGAGIAVTEESGHRLVIMHDIEMEVDAELVLPSRTRSRASGGNCFG